MIFEGVRYAFGPRAVYAAGLIVIECEQPNRKARRAPASPTPSPRTSRSWPRAPTAASGVDKVDEDRST